MKKNALLGLAVVTLAGVGVAMFSRRDTNSAAEGSGPRPLFPGLEDRVNDVARITLEKGDKTLSVERKGEEWTLPERGGYPAKFAEAKKVAVRVARLKIEEEKTSRKANHARLDLEWPAEADDDAGGTEPARVTLLDAAGGELAALIVGKSEWRGGAQKLFVRPASSDQVYLVEGPLDVITEVKSWIEPKILDVARDRVQSVKITHADGELVDINRSTKNHTDLTVQNVPPGEAERYDGVANGVGGVLAGLQMDDVRPLGEIDFGAEPRARSEFRTVDGLVLTIESARFEDKTWLKISSAYEAPKEPAHEHEEGAEHEAEDEGAEAASGADVAQEASDLAQRLSPWAFAIGEYKAEPLAKRMKDLLAQPTPEPEGGDFGGADFGDFGDLGSAADPDDPTSLFENFLRNNPDLGADAPTDDEDSGAAPPASPDSDEVKEDAPTDDEESAPPVPKDD